MSLLLTMMLLGRLLLRVLLAFECRSGLFRKMVTDGIEDVWGRQLNVSKPGTHQQVWVAGLCVELGLERTDVGKEGISVPAVEVG